jgi:23S rRNA pseudouridine1911/1915/1917 synthase
MMPEGAFEFQAEDEAIRLDKFLARRLPELSRSAVQRLIEAGEVAVNGEAVRASYKVRAGDVIVGKLPATESSELVAEPIPLTVVYEDDALLAIDKPAGMVVHPAPGHPSGTLVNALLAYRTELTEDDSSRPGIVHRLDRDTSGLILVAKSETVRRLLQREFKERQVDKTYLALVDGDLEPVWGRIEAPIGRDPYHRQRMAVLAGGREAVTEYHVLERYAHTVGPAAGNYSLIKVEPRTGRTHQIRVHLAALGHPIAGDAVYGRRSQRMHLPLRRQFLHAKRLAFDHPLSGRRLVLEAPLPADLQHVLDLLRSP